MRPYLNQFAVRPEKFAPQDWLRLKKLFTGTGFVHIKLLVNMPLLSAERARLVDGMREHLERELPGRLDSAVTITRETDQEGADGKPVFKIRRR